MAEHIIEMQLHQQMPLGDIGVGTDDTASQQITRLRHQPGPPLCAAPYHHAAGPAFGHGSAHIGKIADIAIGQNRQAGRGNDIGDPVPIGGPVIHLAAGAPMDRQHLDAGLLGDDGKPVSIQAVIIPAKPHFQRDRNIHRADHSLHDRAGKTLITHQRRTG